MYLRNGTLLAMGLAGSSRIELTGHQSDRGRWRAAQRVAHPRLRDYVMGYFASEGFLPKPLYERHIPTREVTIMLNFAAPHKVIYTADAKRTTSEHRNGWVVAPQHCHHTREASGIRDFMVIRCTPIGAQMVLRTPMNLLTDRIVALEDIDSQFSSLLMSPAEAMRDWTARFDMVENIIAERLASAPCPPAGLLNLCRILQAFPNDVDLAMLPKEFGCSRRHLIGQFHKYVGMAPKMIARISRFNLALAAVHRLGRGDPSLYAEGKPYLESQADTILRTQPKIRWADLAVGWGYYDQSHFINEFRSFAGLSPVEFLQQTCNE
jgi:AraC-like DNA-binding protein